ncbi:MAG: AraC family transcriptional regulator [Desulfobacter postgatei]|uniref:AraC family transcriptional regulator n=1 Tax=Desulfobacter postgatei TaxID=2293 RepID=UPI0023F2130D|nr:AraC family transcriptional regulator [Desulfobacter postgatei]MDD4274835.1 AraC family transcriptional regulator [Desulfobacter postgatei]
MPQTSTLSQQNPEEYGEVQEALAEKIAKRLTHTNRLETVIPGLLFSKYDGPTEPVGYMHKPSICMALQGVKRIILGEEAYVYDAYHFLLTSVDLPVMVQVVEASPEVPYLGLVLTIDLKMVSQMMVDSSLPLPQLRQASRAMAVSKGDVKLLNAFHRLVDLQDTPDDIPILSALIQREIVYRLLVGDQGNRLRQMAVAGSHSSQIGKSVQWLKENFTKPLRVDDLANLAGMSSSTFHQHFRALTAMSPLQYQKWMRLHESRRLMLTDRLDAATAAFQVGYESPSQFSREYSRLFGAPPLRDIKNLTQSTAHSIHT